MNWLDYILIALLAFSAIQSFRRGFSREIISLVAAIFGLVLGMWFYRSAAAFLKQWITSDRTANFAGFILVFLAVVTAGAIVGFLIRRFISVVGLSFFDRLLGAAFGLARGAIVAMALLTAWMAFGPRGDSKTAPFGVVHSQIAPILLRTSSVLVEIAPYELKRSFREVYDEARTEIQNLARPHGASAENEDSGKK